MQMHTFLYRLRLLSALFFCSMLFGSAYAQAPTINLQPNYFICSGSVVQFFPEVNGGTEPYTYSWTPAANLSCSDCLSPDVFVSVTTTYQLTVIDALGEEATATTVVTVEPPLVLDINLNTVDCGITFGTVTALITGGTAPYTYAWSTGQTTPSLGPTPPGTYCVTVTSSFGCVATDCINVTQSSPIMISGLATPASCGSSSDGSIAIAVSGGMPPYTYGWTNGQTTANATDLEGGEFYSVLVTDANGCSRAQQFFVGSQLVVDAANQTLDCNTGLATLFGIASQSGDNITYEWTGPNGFSSPDLETVVSEPGTYTLRATNTDLPSCYSEYSITVTSFNDYLAGEIKVELLSCNNYRLSGIIPPNSPTIVFEWTLPDGSTQAQQSIIATQTGVYQLRTSVLLFPDCDSYLTQFIDLEAQSCATLDGRIVNDANINCIADAAEAGLGDWIVTAASATDTFFAITNANGEYSFSLPLGNYSLSVAGPSASWQTCATIPGVSLPTAGAHATVNIPIEIIVQCPELSVTLSSPLLRRCFNSYYYINVCNIGTEIAAAPQVTLNLDDLLAYQTSSLAPGSVDGQTITWTLSDLAPGECRQFSVTVLVSCNALAGQTHCSEVLATPDPLCAPASGNWSGASLELSGECDGNEVLFRVRNNGTGDLAQPVEYIVIEDAVMLMQAPGTITTLPVSDETLFSFPANGSTYTFQLQQAAFHPYAEASPSVAVEGCGLNDEGTFSTGWTTQFPLETATLASDLLCLPNIGSYDPNDKSALPTGYGSEHYLKAGDEINYLIRFQNTGTDTAFTIIIRDTLAPWLDMTSLRRGNSSHPYRLDIQGNRTLAFMFDNILLPDSTTNLEGSNGFVDFKIRTLATTPLETRLENAAAIYFDFNEPVITNTVFHTIGRNFIEIATWTSAPGLPDVRWNVYPNPTPGTATLELANAPSGIKILVITDANGREVKRLSFEGNQLALNEALPAGWYALRLLSAKGQSLGSGKLIVKGL